MGPVVDHVIDWRSEWAWSVEPFLCTPQSCPCPEVSCWPFARQLWLPALGRFPWWWDPPLLQSMTLVGPRGLDCDPWQLSHWPGPELRLHHKCPTVERKNKKRKEKRKPQMKCEVLTAVLCSSVHTCGSQLDIFSHLFHILIIPTPTMRWGTVGKLNYHGALPNIAHSPPPPSTTECSVQPGTIYLSHKKMTT